MIKTYNNNNNNNNTNTNSDMKKKKKKIMWLRTMKFYKYYYIQRILPQNARSFLIC